MYIYYILKTQLLLNINKSDENYLKLLETYNIEFNLLNRSTSIIIKNIERSSMTPEGSTLRNTH
jgi:hypothetical protein